MHLLRGGGRCWAGGGGVASNLHPVPLPPQPTPSPWPSPPWTATPTRSPACGSWAAASSSPSPPCGAWGSMCEAVPGGGGWLGAGGQMVPGKAKCVNQPFLKRVVQAAHLPDRPTSWADAPITPLHTEGGGGQKKYISRIGAKRQRKHQVSFRFFTQHFFPFNYFLYHLFTSIFIL